MELSYKIGERKSSEKYYIEYSEFIKNELQIEPSDSIKKLYKEQINNKFMLGK